MTPLEKLDSLDQTKQNAFLALFAGARLPVRLFRRGDTGEVIPPNFGKAECEWVKDWRDFWTRELPELGFTTWHETKPRPALGMVAGSTCWTLEIGITEEGWQAREDYWADVRAACERLDGERAQRKAAEAEGRG